MLPTPSAKAGFFGVGIGGGEVKWSLPDAHTDFIIAVAAEEYGLILVLAIIALYATIVVRSLIRLMRERDTFVRLAGTGLALCVRHSSDHQHGCSCAPATGQGHDIAICELRRLVIDRRGDHRGYAAGFHTVAPARGNQGHPQAKHAMKRHLVIAAGGTGGHMFPAQALAEAIAAAWLGCYADDGRARGRAMPVVSRRRCWFTNSSRPASHKAPGCPNWRSRSGSPGV